jgi:hypothetical protein
MGGGCSKKKKAFFNVLISVLQEFGISKDTKNPGVIKMGFSDTRFYDF